jgi:hypothetical protein
MLVCSVLLGTHASVTGAWMTYLPNALQVPLSSPITGAVVPVATGSSSLDSGGVKPPSKRSHPWSFLLASTWYVCVAEFHATLFPLPAFWIPRFEGSIGLNDRSHTLPVPVIHQQLAMSVVLAVEVPGTGGAPQDVIGTKMSGANVPRSTAPGGAASTPRSLGTMHRKLPRLYLSGSFDSASPPIN